MLKTETLDTKLIYVIGDSHALAFQNKLITLPDNKINFLPKLLYIRGLSIENILNGQNLREEIKNLILQSNLAAENNLPSSLTNNKNILNEQYATGVGFSNQNILFHCGELYIRALLKNLIKQNETIELNDELKNQLRATFTKIITLYFNILKSLATQFHFNISIHDICPPTSNDNDFQSLNGYLVPKNLRSYAYGLFNDLLEKLSKDNPNIFLCTSRDYLENENGFLKAEYDFDSCHADMKYASISLERMAVNWLQSRTAERSPRYYKWFEETYNKMPDKVVIPISSIGITEPKNIFNFDETKLLKDEVFDYEDQLSKHPTLDWASLPIQKRSSVSEKIQIGSMGQKGLRLIYNKFFNSNLHEELKKLLNSDFSIINVRPTKSEPHFDDGIGPQKFHLDYCPPAIFRGIVYLVDVGEDDGAFEYFPVNNKVSSKKAIGKAGDFFLFDANAIHHRGSPPRNNTRIALDFIILAHKVGIQNVVNTNPGTTWPVDPYLFSLSPSSIPNSNSGRWFKYSNKTYANIDNPIAAE
jgi:hypothetical protein